MRIDEQDKVVDSVKIITLMTIPHCVVKASTRQVVQLSFLYLCIKSERTDFDPVAIQQHYLAN